MTNSIENEWKLLSCLTLCDPRDCSPSGTPVPGILQARILPWVGMPSSRGSAMTQGSNPNLPRCRQILFHLMHPVLLCYSYSLAFLIKTNYLPKSHHSSSASRSEAVGGIGGVWAKKDRYMQIITRFYTIVTPWIWFAS